MVIVYHGIVPYERSRHLGMMEAYAQRCRIFYVDPDASGRGAEREIAPRLFRVTMPQALPGGRFRPISVLNRWLGMRCVLAGIHRRHEGPVVLVSQQPDLLPTLRGLPADLKVYEVRDDYAGFALHAGAERRLRSAHLRMLRECDVVWAISQALVDDIRALRPDVERTYVGVECDAFERAAANGAPASLAGLPHPIVGLIGNLNDRVDWGLLESVARAHGAWHFAIVGPVYHASPATEQSLDRLRALPNVHVLGAVPREQLAAAVAALDVGLIPYRLTPATRRINPLKLYQYLASGVPVVATPIPAVEEVGDAATVATNAAEFADAIEDGIASRRRPAACATRRSAARRFDWQAVADRQLAIARAKLEARA